MDWPGLFSDANPHDLPPGAAQAQDNFQCVRPGVLSVRKGLRPIAFAEELDTNETSQVIALYGFRPPTRHYAAFQTSDGKVYLGNLPSLFNPIETGVAAAHPSCFAQDRFGKLVRVNGLERGTIWDGKHCWPLGITPPPAGPTVEATGSEGNITGTYFCGYRYRTARGEYSSLSELTTVAANGSTTLEWSELAASSDQALNESVYRVATVELFRSTANQSTTVYLVKSLGNRGTISASNNNGAGKVRFTMPAGHNLAVGATISVTGHTVPAYNTTHKVEAVLPDGMTVETDVSYTESGTGGTWALTGYMSDDLVDDALATKTALPIYNPDLSPNARAFDPPSPRFQVIVPFQDRLFYLVPPLLKLETYRDAVAGWTTQIIGRYIYRDGYRPEEVTAYSEPGGTPTLRLSESGEVTVESLISDGAMVYGQPHERNLLVYSEQDNFEAVPAAWNQVVLQENTDDNDALVGAIPAGSQLFLCKERHTYSASFVRQPRIDLVPTLRFYRGLLNQNSWDFLGETCYLWDELGVWSISGDQMAALSGPVQDYFREGKIDWAKKKWFFTSAEPNEGVVRFHLALTTDPGEYPARALCYSPGLERWWTESYHAGVSGKCRIRHGDRVRTLVGGQAGKVLLVAEGTSDWLSAINGAVAASSANTLTDGSAEFPEAVVGAPVTITAGTGRGQQRTVVARLTATTIQVSPNWDVNPDTTSRYSIGAIKATMRTGLLSLPELDGYEQPGEVTLVLLHPPTAGDEVLLAELYYDNETSPELLQGGGTLGRTVVTDGSGAVQIRLQAAQSELGSIPGYKRLPWRIKARPKGDSHRFVSVGLECYQAMERLEFYGLQWR